MITAKNYAAQVVKNIKENIKTYSFAPSEVNTLSVMISIIEESVHFAIPDNGKLFDDGKKGLLGSEVRLPYPSITIEYFQPETKSKLLVFANERVKEDGIEFGGFALVGDKLDGFPVYTGFIQNSHFVEKENDLGLFVRFPERVARIKRNTGLSDAEIHASFIDWCYLSLLEFLEALSCTNVEASIHQPASPKNAQRIKSHKLPIYETKVLTIKAGKESLSSVGNGVKGSHQSPRQHLRRGHIRRLEKGNIWVNSCVVGSKENGVIDKQYKVTA